jgi:hypothetical protein
MESSCRRSISGLGEFSEKSHVARCWLRNRAFTEELIARCAPAAVTAIDPSDHQLAYARTRPGAKMTDFRVGDAQNRLSLITASMLL